MSLRATQLFLEPGDGHRAAVSLLDKIEAGIRTAFDKNTMRARVKLSCKVNGPTKLYIKKMLEKDGWTAIYFSTEVGDEFIEMVADITPEEHSRYLSSTFV